MTYRRPFQARALLQSRPHASSLVTFLVAAGIFSALGCGARVEVGEAKPEPMNEPAPAEPEQDAGSEPPVTTNDMPPISEPPDCSGADAMWREVYQAWTQLPNQLGELVGRTFSGYVEGGPDVVLSIDALGKASLIVGEPAPAPQADVGYLCGPSIITGFECGQRYQAPPVEGAVYRLHGASFSAGRLQAPLQPNSPYDAWCKLQTPHEWEDCFFGAIGLEEFSVGYSSPSCSYDGQAVDCGWLELTQLGLCRCTSTDCFADIYAETPLQIDARFDNASGELSGTVIDGERSQRPIHLSEVSE